MSTPKQKYVLLIVDDDKNFLKSLADGIKANARSLDVLLAGNGKEAIEVLKANHIDLLVTDIKMPEMDGIELLAYMVTHHPNIPVIVMTAFATPEIEDRVTNMGTFRFLEKPVDFQMLLEKIYEGMEVGTHYFVKVLSLCSFLQTIGREKRTCTITLKSRKNTGTLYFSNGALIDGETGNAQGAGAVYDIVSWEDVEVEFDNECKKKARKIDVPLNFIIKEELYKRTQMVQDKKETPPGDKKSSEDNKINTDQTDINLAIIRKAIDMLKEDLADALLNTGIISRSDERVILDYHLHPNAGVHFNLLTAFLKRMLSECNMPAMGKYFLIDLKENKSLIVIPHTNYIWGVTIDLTKVTLGLFLNVTLPKIFKAFHEVK